MVEDDPFMRDMISEILTATECAIETAENGTSALEKFSASSNFELIISDLSMPGMGGLDLIRKIRELDSEIPIIVLTGNNDIFVALTAIKSGASDYLLKDENVEEAVLLAISRVLEKKRIVDQNRKLNDFIKKALKKYISPEYVEMLVNKPDMLYLGGEEREVTILFTDIEGFTTIAENQTAKELVADLNEYLDGMTEILLKHKGTLDKYVGDSIIGFWNAPLKEENHVANGLSAALEMADFSAALSRKFQAQRKMPFKTRIGVNTGKAIVGNIGSKDRFNYTAMGDQVNLASRLEALNKLYGTGVLITESACNLSKNQFRVRDLDIIRVKGKDRPVKVYELLGGRDREFDESFAGMMVLYEKGIAAYRDKLWEESRRCFLSALEKKSDDIPSQIYAERCSVLMQDPPPAAWDGVFDLPLNRRRTDRLTIKTVEPSTP